MAENTRFQVSKETELCSGYLFLWISGQRLGAVTTTYFSVCLHHLAWHLEYRKWGGTAGGRERGQAAASSKQDHASRLSLLSTQHLFLAPSRHL